MKRTLRMPSDAAPVRRPAAEPRPDRRQNILLAAEKLFAQRGFHAVSIRDIAEEAQVPLALVGYYFGQKHELYHAIFEHWSTTIEERLAALKLALADPSDDRLEDVVAAFIEPVIRLRASSEGEYYALLMTRGLALQSEGEDAIIREFFDPMARAFMDAFRKVLAPEFPGVSKSQVAWGYQFALGALLHHIGDRRVERLSDGKNKACDPDAMPLLVAFIAQGMRGVMTRAVGKAAAARPPRVGTRSARAGKS
ncbi:MAG: TetR/AcrR family transcriptional regulator [Burkholderiales bacterium]|nr:TetR/AcrR family transcriptional regulator [Burkholderiales bacterium]